VVAGIRHRAIVLGCAGAASALLLVVPAAFANTYRPTRTGDPAPNGCHKHDCSLREAITKANQHSGTDKIVLRGGKSYKLTRNNPGGVGEDLNATGDLDVTDSLRFVSSNRRLATVDANDIDRVFDVGPTSTVSASLKRLRIRGGSLPNGGPGGGIQLSSNSSLVLLRSVVSGNSTYVPGGGIYADAGTSLRISRGAVTGNNTHGDAGGGMEVRGAVTISRSSITGNRGAEGAGIDAFQTPHFRVSNSTIANNEGTRQGGGVRFSGLGSSVATFVNDTIANNRSDTDGGGIANTGGIVNLNAVTVAYNRSDADGNGTGKGGGLWVDPFASAFNVKNSLVARNSAGAASGPDCGSSINQFLSGGHNLIGSTSGCTGFGPPDSSTDIVNPPSSRIKIGTLANHGGPTKTIALKAGSRAISHAGHDAPKRDQRGVKRGKHPDIGAFEKT
jgi:hypothetical protein